MKTIFLLAVLLVTVLGSGCFMFKHKPATARSAAKVETKTIVTPDLSLAAKVVSVNLVGRFVVLNFPAGQLPKTGQPFFLYRAGLWRFFHERLNGLRQRIFFVGRVQVEIDPAQRPRLVALAQNNGDFLV